jgi:hypothetical protein
LHRARDLFMNYIMMDPVLSLAARRPDLKMLLINIAAGNQEVPQGIPLRALLKVMLPGLHPARDG